MTKPTPEQVVEVFNHWNSFKKPKLWKSHKYLDYDMKLIIAKRLKQYPMSHILDAISNYAFILQSPQCKWTYQWTLYQFLTRHNPKYKEELQLFRFLPSTFERKDWIKREYVRSESQKFIPITQERKRELNKGLPIAMQKRLGTK